VLGQRERCLDAQATAPQHNDDRPQPPAVAIIERAAHHGQLVGLALLAVRARVKR
jgi:hypothetical protein